MNNAKTNGFKAKLKGATQLIINLCKNHKTATSIQNQIRPKYLRFRNLQSRYDCGVAMFLQLNPEAHCLKLGIDELFRQLREIDPLCPKEWL